MMRGLGHLLLWVGFISAAFFAVSRLERTDDKWSTIDWQWYGAGIFVGVAGIVILRRVAAEEHFDHAKTDAEYSVLQERLQQIATEVDAMLRDQPGPGEVVRRIDQQCAEPLSDFAEARQALVKRFDIQVFADVMTEFASAERYINRAWSAAADGYVDEVTKSLQIAAQQLSNAKTLMDRAESL